MENLRDRISQFSSHIAMQYMLDVIFGCIYNMDREKNIEYLKKSIDLKLNYQLYDDMIIMMRFGLKIRAIFHHIRWLKLLRPLPEGLFLDK